MDYNIHMSNGARSFTITPSAKAFQILSDKLYKNKHRAVMRELSTNAADSHIMAGQTRPFEVHLPSYAEPYFSVRDYGTGMSKEKIENLYTGYFESDKIDNSEQNGFLGLGSKSPFSLVQSFNITSIYEGIKTIYTTYISEEGVPQIIQIFQEATKEEQGVEIKLDFDPRHDNSMGNFSKELDVFTYFGEHTPLIIQDGRVIPFNQPKFDIIGKNWAWNKAKGYNTRCTAIQSFVEYPISDAFFTDNRTARFILSNNFYLFFDNRSLDFAPSREELNYDTKTRENIVNKCKEVYSSFIAQIQKEIDEQPSLWAAKKYLHSIQSYLSIDHDFTYQGENFNCLPFMVKNLKAFFKEDEIKDIYCSHHAWGKNKNGNLILKTYNAEYRKDKRKPEYLYRFGNFHVDSEYLFFVNDIGKKMISRKRALHYASKRNNAVNIIILPRRCNKLLQYLGGFEHINVSTLEDPPVTTTVSFDRSDICVQKNGYWNDVKEDIDFNKTHFYTVIKRYYSYHGDVKVGNQYLRQVIKKATGFKILPEDVVVYGVKAGATKKKQFQNGNWVEIYSYVTTQFEKLVEEKKNEISDILQKKNIQKIADKYFVWNINSFIDKHKNEIAGTRLAKMFDDYKNLVNADLEDSDIDDIKETAKLLNLDILDINEIDEVKALKRFNFYDIYPMLRFAFSTYRFQDKWTDIVAYINMIG